MIFYPQLPKNKNRSDAPAGLLAEMAKDDKPGGLLGQFDDEQKQRQEPGGLLDAVGRLFDPRPAALAAANLILDLSPTHIRPTIDPITRETNWAPILQGAGKFLSENMGLPGGMGMGLPGPTASAPVTSLMRSMPMPGTQLARPWSVESPEFPGVFSESDNPEEGRRRSREQAALIDALKRGEGDVSFGQLSKKKFDAINAIREANGIPLLTSPELTVPSNVVRKLVNKRMLAEGMSADEVADTIYSAFHNTRSRVMPSKYSHIQQIMRPGERLSNFGFVGQSSKDETPVVKSGYKKPTKDAQ